MKVRRYTPGVDDVQTKEPLLVEAVGEGRIGRVKRVLVVIVEVVDEIQSD